MAVTEKYVDVELENEDGSTRNIKILVKKPSNAILSAAQRKGALIWTQCIQEGVMTKKELETILKQRGIWTEAKNKEQEKILEEISKLEKKLYLGKKGSKMKLSQAKDIAFEMRKKRLELRDLLASKIELEGNTAESLSENAKFDYLVANCTFYEDGKNVYNSVEEYNDKSEDPIAFSAAATLAALMYSLDKDFEEKLPENQFLIKANLVNDDLALVNKDGNRVDTEGRLINNLGQYVNGDGNRVDIHGHPLVYLGAYDLIIQYHQSQKLVALVREPRSDKTYARYF